MTQGDGKSGAGKPWLIAGLMLLAYAVAGNWLALPGYKRFLAGERSGASGLELAWGASRTILWMLSFHLGALCLAYGTLKAHGDGIRRFRRWFMAGALVWISLWMIPVLPGPYTAFFAGLGIAILVVIGAVFLTAAAAGRRGAFFPENGEWRVASYFFFALATWDICGLGSVGGILDPSGEARAASQTLVVAQTTKLIVELAIAWTLLAVAALPARRA